MHVASYRVVAQSAATIRWRPVDQDGEPVSATGTPTATVTRADGTAVTPVTVTIDEGWIEIGLTAIQTAALDLLTVTVALDAITRGTFSVEVYGRPIITVAEVREHEPSLIDESANSNVAVRRAITHVDAMFQRACGHVLSFVPRFGVSLIQQNYRSPLSVPHYFLRTVEWAQYEAVVGTWTAVDIVNGVTLEDGYAYLNSGWWPYGRVQIGYTHGLEAPPEEVTSAAAAAVRRVLNRPRSGIDPRAMSHTNPQGEVQRFPTPGLGPWITGTPEIDEVLAWYRTRYPVLAGI